MNNWEIFSLVILAVAVVVLASAVQGVRSDIKVLQSYHHASEE